MIEFEQFAAEELKTLRDELRQSGLDSFQSGALVTAFLSAKGYGVSNEQARDAVVRMEALAFPLALLQAELQKLALVM